jgi:hypothetical protein
MSKIVQNSELIRQLLELLAKHRGMVSQERVYQRVVALAMSELMVFARHTITQQLMALGLTEEDWSAWYRLLSAGRFDADYASNIIFSETLAHVSEDEVYVVAGDGTQTPRSNGNMEGSSWLKNPRTPVFMPGIHYAQRWFHGAWLMPAENGYSRALPLKWMAAFTEKSKPQAHAPCKEWQTALNFLRWLREGLIQHGRPEQRVLMVADGGFDTLKLWQHLPDKVTLMARSAKNRVLYQLPPSDCHPNRKYGIRAPTPQQHWNTKSGWKHLTLGVRGKDRHLQYQVAGPYLRQGAPDRPLFLIVVRGKDRDRNGKPIRRPPLPFLVNARLDEQGQCVLPLPVKTLLFWAWQRWEIEVCHRELKSNFGLGQKQCWNPIAAVASVQWSAWVYALMLMAGYRTWGLANAPPVPTRWWRGSGRWSLNTLWRGFRAALWGDHHFRPLWTSTTPNWLEKEQFLMSLSNAVVAAARS